MSAKSETVYLSKIFHGIQIVCFSNHIFLRFDFILLQLRHLDNYGKFLFAKREGASDGFHIFGSFAHRIAQFDEQNLIFAVVDQGVEFAPENYFFGIGQIAAKNRILQGFAVALHFSVDFLQTFRVRNIVAN